MMVHPLAIRATFLMSGMLGLRFGLGGGGNEKPKMLEARIPFNITLENQTALIEIPPSLLDNIIKVDDITSTTIKTTARGTRQARTFQLPGFKTRSTYDFALNGKCGPGKCNQDQMCVTWIKQRNAKSSQRESPMMVHECLKRKGEYHKKLHPSGGGLCINGEIPLVISEPQKCLNYNPPCPLVWKYKCSKESDTSDKDVQSCRYKSCPSGESCLEVAECGEEPPCISIAVCK